MKDRINKHLNKKECEDLLFDLFMDNPKNTKKIIEYNKSAKKVKKTFGETKKIFKKSPFAQKK